MTIYFFTQTMAHVCQCPQQHGHARHRHRQRRAPLLTSHQVQQISRQRSLQPWEALQVSFRAVYM